MNDGGGDATDEHGDGDGHLRRIVGGDDPAARATPSHLHAATRRTAACVRSTLSAITPAIGPTTSIGPDLGEEQ